ncbi:MAG: ABC transporter permease [Clostridia bacterium]|nr:ABC transporter permease [Clostridia bacterium]
MLGIIIGVTALVVLVSLVQGATGLITDEVNALGNDMLTVTIADDKGAPLRLEDLSDLALLPQVGRLAPTGSMHAAAKYQAADASVTVYGTTPAYYDIYGLQLEAGRFLKAADLDNRSYVAVLSYQTAVELFGKADVVGSRFAIDGRSFDIVGVLAEDTSMMSSMMSELAVYIPFTVESRMAGEPYVTSFAVSAGSDCDLAEQSVSNELLSRFQHDDEAFSIVNMSSISSTMETVTGTLSLLLGGIAAISLLVGGIGIMNIMLVSVTERTREIGIRKAIGADHRSIMAQFLIEALMISLLGCFFGLLLSGVILSAASMLAASITFSMSPNVVLLSVGFSSGVGLLFGLYPAHKAAKKQPIQALRYEG